MKCGVLRETENARTAHEMPPVEDRLYISNDELQGNIPSSWPSLQQAHVPSQSNHAAISSASSEL
jgi:hypothetical protein